MAMSGTNGVEFAKDSSCTGERLYPVDSHSISLRMLHTLNLCSYLSFIN